MVEDITVASKHSNNSGFILQPSLCFPHCKYFRSTGFYAPAEVTISVGRELGLKYWDRFQKSYPEALE